MDWRAWVASAVGLCTWVGPSWGAEPAPMDVAAGDPVLVTVSGGVSLGAYEAGALYALTEIFKRSVPRKRVVLAAGASAGSINAFTTAMASCLPPNPDPTRDPGYAIWTDVDFEGLFDEASVSATHAFTDRSLKQAASRLATTFGQGLPVGCDVVVGATATRVAPKALEVAPGLGLRREAERFVFRIVGRGPGVPPDVDNHIDPDAPIPEPRLPFVPGDGDANFAHLRTLFLASAAFPVAFPPQRIAHCLARVGERASATCTAAEAEVAAFIDGGVFDNSPLRLAYEVAARGLTTDAEGRPRWRDPSREPLAAVAGSALGARLVYLNPSRALLPEERADAERATEDSLLTLLGHKLGDFIQTARARELYALFEAHPEVRGNLLALSRRFPTASGHLGAFLGFFEREFRVFDFYLGLYDAYHDLGGANVRAGWIPDDLATMPAGWRPFACMLAAFDGEEALRPACDGNALASFRVLVQVALDRAYALCADLPIDLRPSSRVHAHCARAADGASPPRLVGPAATAWRRAPDESDFDHTLRLLTAYRFAWRDLGLGPDEASYGRVRLRRRLLATVEALADAQDDPTTRALVLTAGRLGVNGIVYEPPVNYGYGVLGSNVELGASLQPFSWNTTWLRMNLALSVDGLLSRLASGSVEPLTLDASAGPEFALLFLTSPVIQPLVGLRAGYRLSTADDFGTGACSDREARGSSRHCSQFLLQSYFALAVLELFRAQITLDLTPIPPALDPAYYALQFGIGLNFF